ncbi:MAG: UDP-N-acetylmuramate--L-alanine ligase [Thermosulfidibacteraceae bacterium]|jgi:UDP-N-acetylmuramate--alanine ligase
MEGKVHFIGIGGIGMSALARILLTLGVKVTGSDVAENANTKDLKNMGVEIWIPHDPEKIHRDTRLVVYSSAIRDDNPELVRAKNMGIEVISRGELLARITKEKTCIAVAGSHGKTTTTAMIGKIFFDALFKPTLIVGGRLKDFNSSNALWGDGGIVITESDESDGSFLHLEPYASVVTNVDREHLSYYGSFEKLVEAFRVFCKNTKSYKVVCGDDQNLRDMNLKGVIYYGLDPRNDVVIESVRFYREKTFFTVRSNWGVLDIELSVLGLHNVKNATASYVMAKCFGIGDDIIYNALSSFSGVERRLTVVGVRDGIVFIDDYAHHPTEVKATLSALRQKWIENRIIVVFQPHRYSRMKYVFEDLLGAFDGVDEVWVTDVYSAGELNTNGFCISEFVRLLCDRIGCVKFYSDWREMVNPLKKTLKKGDVLVTLGAGDIGKLCRELLKE